MAQTDININVSPEVLDTQAGRIETIAVDMRDHLDNILNKIDTLAGGTWQSPASEETERKIKAFATLHYDEFENKMKEFATRLRTIAEIYRKTDATQQQTAASTFQE